MVLDQHYISLKNQVIKAERRVLKELGFCVHVKHPHKVSYSLILLKNVRLKYSKQFHPHSLIYVLLSIDVILHCFKSDKIRRPSPRLARCKSISPKWCNIIAKKNSRNNFAFFPILFYYVWNDDKLDYRDVSTMVRGRPEYGTSTNVMVSYFSSM